MSPADGRPAWARCVAQLALDFALFASLLFLTRFVLRGYLAVPLDEECHIGGIAVDVLAAGIRFPAMVYVQSEYDNGSLISGLLTAGTFSLLGRNLLALKLVVHLISAAGAVAALWLLRGCLQELGLTSRRLRWTAIAALAIGIALAPEAVTLPALCTVGMGSPAEGAAIDALLLALFASRLRDRSPLRIGVFWALVGVALHINHATLPVIPVLAAAEVALARRTPRRLLAAGVGFLIGSLRELTGQLTGWSQLLDKAQRHSNEFPAAFFSTVWNLSEQRPVLIVVWTLSVAFGIALVARALPAFRRWWAAPTAAAPLCLALVVGAALVQLAALVVMAQGGFDYYPIYAYPMVMILFAVLVAWTCAAAAGRWHAGLWLNLAAVAVALVVYRPLAMSASFATVSSLWHNRDGAACSWRLAEGFRREFDAGLARPGQTLEQYVVERCRLLSEPAQVIDCVGGLARDIHYTFDRHIEHGPPTGLSDAEARAFAYYYGVRRNGAGDACADFLNADLRSQCAAAVELDCVAHGGWGNEYSAAGRAAQCAIPPPPMQGYWSALRTTMLTTVDGVGPRLIEHGEGDAFPGCKAISAACYAAGASR